MKKIKKLWELVKSFFKKKEKERVPQINYVLQTEIDGFKKTSELIYKEWNNVQGVILKYEYVFPYVVNTCFCCELLLKNHFNEKAKNVFGHDLKKMYNKLDDPIKDLILKSIYNATTITKANRKDFASNMTKVRKGFEKFRYAYEDKTNKPFNPSAGDRTVNKVEVNISFLKKFLNALEINL